MDEGRLSDQDFLKPDVTITLDYPTPTSLRVRFQCGVGTAKMIDYSDKAPIDEESEVGGPTCAN